MPNSLSLKKGLSLGISLLLIAILFLDLVPVSSAVYVSTGNPDKTSIDLGSTVIFNNVDLTIRSPERIPVSYLDFRILSGSIQVSYVRFNIDGSIVSQSPSATFTVNCLTDISSIGYGYGYGDIYYGYDEIAGTNHTYSYGYGYGAGGYSDTHVVYRISYKTHVAGTLRAKLYVNSVSHTYESDYSMTFTVTSYVAGELFVDDDNTIGPWTGSLEYPYNRIADAIDASHNGDTIYVRDGTYNENLVVDKSIHILGPSVGEAIVKNIGSLDVILITADNARINGLTIIDATYPKTSGISIKVATNCNIVNNKISNCYNGIYVKSSTDDYLSNNTVDSNVKYGIYLDYSSHVTINENSVINNPTGIFIYDSDSNILSYNKVENNTHGLYLTTSEFNTFVENIVKGSSYGFYVSGSSNNVFSDNSVSSNVNGLYLEDSVDNSIGGNILFYNTYGLYFASATGNEFIENEVSNNTEGCYLIGSTYNTFTGNDVVDNFEEGFDIRYSSGNMFKDNYITGNDYGMYVTSSNYNSIFNNYFANDKNAWDDSTNHWNISTVTSGVNIIGGSYFGGNYWNDYNGVDLDGDGLGDNTIPYNCGGSIVRGGDYYPLASLNENDPPNRPSTPFGPTSGRPGTFYSFRSSCSDPDSDKIYFKWDWGDGSSSGWMGPYDSGYTCEAMHSWSSERTYEIRVKTKDIYGAESEWSDSLPIKLPKGKNDDSTSRIQQLIQKFLSMFPFLEKIIEFIQSSVSKLFPRLGN